MQANVFNEVIDILFGNKYYANIIGTKGTDKTELCSYIFSSKEEAEVHRKQIETTLSFAFIETVTFRSRKSY